MNRTNTQAVLNTYSDGTHIGAAAENQKTEYLSDSSFRHYIRERGENSIDTVETSCYQ